MEKIDDNILLRYALYGILSIIFIYNFPFALDEISYAIEFEGGYLFGYIIGFVLMGFGTWWITKTKEENMEDRD